MEIKKLIINNHSIGTIGIADQFLLRLRGLIRRDFSRFDALLIQPCSEIHTMFMAYPIDVLFINKTGKVMKYNKMWHEKEGWPLYIIKDASHNANDDQPEKVNKLLEEFVQELH